MEQNLEQYAEAFTQALDKQLAVYTTIGKANVESPMWFQLNKLKSKRFKEDDVNAFYFQSSQVNYMFFHVAAAEDDDPSYYRFDKAYAFFRDLKYAHIKANWPTVYKELRK